VSDINRVAAAAQGVVKKDGKIYGTLDNTYTPEMTVDNIKQRRATRGRTVSLPGIRCFPEYL
jgi:hypothetical protein